MNRSDLRRMAAGGFIGSALILALQLDPRIAIGLALLWAAVYVLTTA